jgi:YD repeat-containing protein
MRRTASAPRARLVRSVICLTLLAQTLIPRAAAAPAVRAAGIPSPAAGRAAARQEAEAADLPDLKEMRNRPRREPKAVPPVPSTRRRCPPRNPRCNEDVNGAPQATPTPASTLDRPGRGNPHASQADADPTPGAPAWGGGRREVASATPASSLSPFSPAGYGPRPRFDLSLLDFISADGGYSVSDAPARLMLGAVYAAAPAAFFQQSGVNVAAAANGATAQGSTSYDAYGLSASRAINGSRTYAGSYWNDQTLNTLPDWLQINFAGARNLVEIDLFFLQDNLGTAEPTEAMTFTQFGITNFDVQYWTGSAWATVPNGSVTGNNKVWRKFTFAPLTTDKIRVFVNAATDGWSRIVEVEAYDRPLQAVPPQGIPPAESVAWTNASGVTASGNSLTKVAVNGWDAGAMSSKAIASGDGYAEFTVTETNTNRMFGLSHGDSDQSYADIDFALHTQDGGGLYAFEAGVTKGYFGTCAAGDRLRVSVAGGVVSYKKNGVTFYTSAAAPRYPLLVDASLYNQGTTLNNALLSGALVENVVWTNVAGVTAAGNNLSKGGADAWNAGASSTRVLAGGDGYAEFTVSETNTYRMFGLSRGDSNQDYPDIDFALFPAADGWLYVYEAGVYKATLSTYAAFDRLRVSVEGGQVRYRRNGALLYTSGVAPQYPLLVDTSVYSTGATVYNAVISAPLPSPADPGGTGLTGRYYDNLDFTAYKLTRLDPTVNFDWAGGSPSASMGVDDFSVRWTGMVVPRYSETYTFYTTTDDGVRLWVDGQLVIDRWQDQAPYEAAGTIALEAGRQYTVRMEYYERGGGALAWLKWYSTSQAKEIVPQSRLLPCWKSVEQFVTDFYQAVLRRAPTSYELQDWTERLAQAQGEAQQTAAAQALGRTILNSTEYATLNPSDTHRFVSDLYWGYLQRAPDVGGWSWWEGRVNSYGRGEGIVAFEESIEFKEKVARLCGTAVSSGTNGGDGYNFAAARLDPSNRTGGGGADAYSRNYNFSIPLVSLPGRAGLDLGLMLSYNSLVWTKDGTGVTFDADRGTPSPGFRLGFPTLHPKFYNPQTQKYAYLLVTPSGGRVELRQVGTSNVYESADSSYMQLTEGGLPTLLAADGTQLSFTAAGGEWRCYQVKDGNGNYLTVSYYGDGRIDKVTDTLGRAVTFNYDNYQNLLSITQPWTREGEPGVSPGPSPDEAHQWATFGYANVTLQPQFSNLAVIGEQTGTVLPALSQVGLDDGSYFKFSYNQWGQVWKVTHYAADSVAPNGQPNESHPLSSTRLDLPGSDLQAASPQADCPRFTQERVWVEYGVMNQSAEVVTSYDQWAPNMASCQMTFPDNTTKLVSSYHTSADGWKKGLTASEVTTSGGTPVRTATLTWEHDGGVAIYPTNPRVTQTSISDPQAHTRTTKVTYTLPGDFQGESGYTGTLNLSLPKKVEECADSNCSTALRTTVTDYKVPNLGQYVARRVLGLTRYQSVYDGADATGNLRLRVEYRYDEPSDGQDTFLATLPTPAFQHDGTNYGQAMTWRGHANRVRRYSVDQTTGAVGGYVESRAAFNVTGTVAYTKDAAGHKTSLNYADSFYQNINRTHPDPQYRLPTYAYPTTFTDPDNFTGGTVYNYDLGVLTEARTPEPNKTTNLPGPLSHSYYDAAGRRVRSLVVDTGADTRVVYPTKMDLIESYTLVEAGIESRSTQVLDGAGRTRAVSRYLPPLSDAGTGAYPSNYNYAGQKFDYDVMGRLVRQSDPAEVTAAWTFAGEDSAWAYTSQTYDWKGRPLVVTHEADGSKFEYQYGGCGCAGGQTVSTRDEVGRRQRVTYDVTGRTETTQVFTQQATNVGFTISPTDSPYSTVTNTYDALGRIREVRERDEARGVEQVATTEYDGHGRVWRRRLPQYVANKFITYAYNDDDTLASVTDPRDAVTAYDYEENKRHLVKKITHTLPGSPTLTTTFQYDAAGNRKVMDDGPGWVTYEYDMLSRPTKESRHFDGLNAAVPNNLYELTYTYTPSGKLKTLSDPFGAQFTYHFDRAGQLRKVTGSPYATVSTYAQDVEYRAWGGVKSASFGDNAAQTTSYDSRMRPLQYRLAGGSATPQREDFTYYADGRLKRITDLDDGTRQTSLRYHTMSRAYTYDHVGRVKEAGGHAAAEPGGNTGSPNWPSPYLQSYGYDGFDNLTSRSGTYGYRMSQADTPSYVNNRRQGWDYDAGGRVTHSTDPNGSERTWTYDAAGRLVTTAETAAGVTSTLTQAHDGDGRLVHSSNGSTAGTDYEVRSSVLGGEVVTRLNQQGGKGYTYVPAGGLVRARQVGSNYYGQPAIEWSHPDPVGVTESGPGGPAAYDPLGNFAPLPPPPPQSGAWPQPSGSYGPIWGGAGSLFSNVNDFSTGCLLDGRPADCNRVAHELEDGLAGVDPNTPWYTPRAGGVTYIPVTRTRTIGEVTPGADGPRVLERRESTTTWVPVPDGVFTPPPDVKKIGEILQEILSNSSCSEFVSALYKQVDTDNPTNEANSKTILELFGKVTAPGQGGIIRRYPLIIGGKSAAGTVSGSLDTSNATVILAGVALYGGIAAASSEELSRTISISDAMTTLHELFHLAGTNWGFSDKQLAKAAAKLPGASSGLPNEDEKDSYEWSKYWDRELQNHCKRPEK